MGKITSQGENNRIAKNTLMLYFRMFITMAVGLYTSRIVLAILGVQDYGIYNVVAGIVAMFSFLSGAMATASQRFFAFELGKGKFSVFIRDGTQGGTFHNNCGSGESFVLGRGNSSR